VTIRRNLPWLAAAVFALIAGTFAGLVRIGWRFGLPAGWIADHGPLMVAGFLGTLITLERAVALGRLRFYWGAAAFALGGLALLAGIPPVFGRLMFVLGSLGLVEIFVHILRSHRAIHAWVMGAGAFFLLAGSALRLAGWSAPLVVPWWSAFLVLTIAGERLELGRLTGLPAALRRRFVFACAVFAAGTVLTAFAYDIGIRAAGAGLVGLALWGLRHDIATRTIRKPGLTRFIAVCMLSGYAWLIAAGLLQLVFGAELAGPRYDAQIHSLFLGFVFSMIFGHAPIIFPAILNLRIRYSPRFYLHLVLLHASLAARVFGDLAGMPEVRRWAAMVNGIALLVFLVNNVISLRTYPKIGAVVLGAAAKED
jgi:hypothetical protein